MVCAKVFRSFDVTIYWNEGVSQKIYYNCIIIYKYKYAFKYVSDSILNDSAHWNQMALTKKCSVRKYISHDIRQIKFIHVHTVSFNETAMELKYVCFDGCMKMRTSSKL